MFTGTPSWPDRTIVVTDMMVHLLHDRGNRLDAAGEAGLPAVLSQMQYSRAMETDADDYALAVLRRNGLGAAPLVHALTLLQRQHPDDGTTPRWLKNTMTYLSTHPATRERIARLRAAEAEDAREEDPDN